MSRFVTKELKKIYLDDVNYSEKSLEELKEIALNFSEKFPENIDKEDLIRILDDKKEWVKIPKALSFDQVSEITIETDHVKMSKKMLVVCIKEWNLKDDKGNIPEVNEKNILNLDVKTITQLTNELTKIISPENKEESKKK